MISEYAMCVVSGTLKSKAYKGATVRYQDTECRLGPLLDVLTSGDAEMADLTIECVSYYPVFYIREQVKPQFNTDSVGTCVSIWTAP